MRSPLEQPCVKRVFVVGCPRSGTTWTMWLLAQHPSVVACNHAGLFHALAPLEEWWRTPRGYSGGIHVLREDPGSASGNEARPYTRLELAQVLSADDFYDTCRPLAEAVFARIAACRPGATVVVEQTPENIDFAQTILRILPDAYFLHVIRDPRSTFASMRMASRKWAGADFPRNPVGAARMWVSYVSRGREIGTLTERYREVCYENLLRDGPAALQRIFEWLALDGDRSLCERAVRSSSLEQLRDKDLAPKGFFRQGLADGWRRDVPRSHLRTLEYVAGTLMDELGYERACERQETKPIGVRLHDSFAEAAAWLKGSRLARPLRRASAYVRGL